MSVHDKWIYSQTVDHEQRRIVLHTVLPHVDPVEYTDIVFEEVVVHHFEQQMMNDDRSPGNVLFDVDEASIQHVLEKHLPVLERLRNYGWPVPKWPDLADLSRQLTARGANCFEVHGTCGLSGFVIAGSMDFRRRESRAVLM